MAGPTGCGAGKAGMREGDEVRVAPRRYVFRWMEPWSGGHTQAIYMPLLLTNTFRALDHLMSMLSVSAVFASLSLSHACTVTGSATPAWSVINHARWGEQGSRTDGSLARRTSGPCRPAAANHRPSHSSSCHSHLACDAVHTRVVAWNSRREGPEDPPGSVGVLSQEKCGALGG